MNKILNPLLLSFSFVFLIGVSFILPAQSVWQTEVPCGPDGCWVSNHSNLIKATDGNFLVGLNGTTFGDTNQNRIYLYKYDQEGSLIWGKSYHFGATTPDFPHSAGPRLYRFVEDVNGDIICIGVIVDGSKTPVKQSYFFRANSDGDSLSLTVDSSYVAYNNIIQLSGDEYFTLRTEGYNRLGYSGEIIDEKDIENFASSLSGILIQNDNVFVGRLGDNPYTEDSSKYEKYDLYTGEFLLQKKYVDIGDLLILDDDDHIVAYSSGLMKMDTEFNPIWVRPFEDFNISTPGGIQHGQAILKTQDGGFILGGDLENGLSFGVFLIKTNNEGIVEWRVAQNGFLFGIEYMFGLIQADDGGYVFLGGGDDGFYNLVKLNSDGLYTATNDLESSSASIQVYPNPCQDFLYLSSPEILSGTLRIYNAYGSLMQQFQINDLFSEIKTQNLSPGIYFLEYVNGNNQMKTIRFIKS